MAQSKHNNRLESDKSRSILIIGMPSWGVSQPFHALAIIAAIARDTGWAAHIFDANIAFFHTIDPADQATWADGNNAIWFKEPYPKKLWHQHESWLQSSLKKKTEETAPALVAFSVNMANRFFSIYAAAYLKKQYPDIPVIFGGVDCFPAEYNTAFLSPFAAYCDIICQGEAEIAFLNFLKEFSETNSVKTAVPGFAYYDGDKLVNTGDTALPSLKNPMPVPAYELFDMSSYTDKGALPFYLSRGCVYKCGFCSERPNFRKYRHRNPEEAFNELLAILPFAQEYTDVPSIALSDSNININIKALEKFAELITDSSIRIQWGGQAHFSPLLTTARIKKLARSGMCAVFWGFESGSRHVIDLMKKKYDHKTARRIIYDCSRLGIQQHLPVIIGFPGETPADLVDTIECILEYQDVPFCRLLQPALLVVRPNSPLHDQFKHFGLANNNYYDWRTSDQSNTINIRVVRRFIARQAYGNRDFSLDTLEDTEEIKAVDLNSDNVALDMFNIIQNIFSRSDNGSKLETMLDTVTNKNAPAKSYQDTWMKLEKNSGRGKTAVYTIILTGLSLLKQKISENVK